MRKLVLFLSLLGFLNTIKAQETPDSNIVFSPIMVMGIPMQGNISAFQKELEAKGFVFEKINQNNLVVLHGKFIGYNVIVLLQPAIDNTIQTTSFIFSDNGYSYTTWKEILYVYNDIKQLLVKKYGNPVKVEEHFTPSTPSSDVKKMLKLKYNEAVYECLFHIIGKAEGKYVVINGVPVGSVDLSMESRDATVRLTYTSYQNESQEEQNRINDI